MWWFCKRRTRKTQDADVKEAHRELEVSRERLRVTREQVIRPLQVHNRDNHFADMIRDSLREGYGGK